MSFYHTQDFTITVLLHHIENLRYKTIQEHVVSLLSNNYCAVFVVHFWSVFDITSMPWHKRPHLNLCCPQFLNLSFYLSHTKDRRSLAKFFSTPSAKVTILYTLTVDTYTNTHPHTCIHAHTYRHTGSCADIQHRQAKGLQAYIPTQKQTVHSSRGFYYRCHFF